MKKVAILVLLTALIASLSFAQVSLTTTFEIGNINNADLATRGGGAAVQTGVDPNLTFKFDGAAKTNVGPGTLTLAGELSYVAHFSDKAQVPGLVAGSAETNSIFGGNQINGDNFIKLGYAVPVGPGNVDLGVQEGIDGPVYNWYVKPWAGYTGIAAGPVNLGVVLYYTYAFGGYDSDNYAGAYIRPSGWTADADLLTFQLLVDFSFGLGLEYDFVYAVGPAAAAKVQDDLSPVKNGIYKIAYLNLYYNLGALKVGVEVDDTGPKFRGAEVAKTGFLVKPYADIVINDSLAAGFYLKASQILNDTGKDILFSPGVWVKYTL